MQKRISAAIDTCSGRIDEECLAYAEVATSEEDRTSMLSKVVSMMSSDEVLGDDHDDAIHR